MDTPALGAAVVDSSENAGLAFSGQLAGLIDALHLIRPVGGDPALVRFDNGQLE
jgi:hypothetical protein